MIVTFRSVAVLFMALMFICEVISIDSNVNPRMRPYSEEKLAALAAFVTKEEFTRKIHSLYDAIKADMMDGRMIIQTNALIDTKYKTWKRNADLINSILALPKGMNDAGR